VRGKTHAKRRLPDSSAASLTGLLTGSSAVESVTKSGCLTDSPETWCKAHRKRGLRVYLACKHQLERRTTAAEIILSPLVRDLSSNITFAGHHLQSQDGLLLSFPDARVGRSHRLASRPPDLARGSEPPQHRVSMSDSGLMDTIKPGVSAWSHVPDELPGRRATLSSRARYWALGSAFATLTLGVMGSVSPPEPPAFALHSRRHAASCAALPCTQRLIAGKHRFRGIPAHRCILP